MGQALSVGIHTNVEYSTACISSLGLSWHTKIYNLIEFTSL